MSSNPLVGLEQTTPYLAWGGKIKPRELDITWQYCLIKPGASSSAIVDTTAGTATSGTVDAQPDYPRALTFGYYDVSGTTEVSTAVIDGKNQFGEVISETLTTVGGTCITEGTKIFAYVGTVTFSGANRAAGDDMTIGYTGVTAGTAKFGLPAKIGAATDVKNVIWVDNGVTTPGTAVVDTVNHAISVIHGTTSVQDDYVITFVPTYNTNDDSNANQAAQSYLS